MRPIFIILSLSLFQIFTNFYLYIQPDGTLYVLSSQPVMYSYTTTSTVCK
jgi:hypothetical protein